MVSVIVPVYNAGTFLVPCLNSIIYQSYRDIEIILVDDGSTDNSGELCDKYAKEDKRIKVIHQSNSGASEARYNGVKNANGEWSFFVDADDEITPNAIEVLIKHSAQFDIVSGSMVIYYIENNITRSLPSHIKEMGEFSNIQFLENQILGTRLPCLVRQLIKTSILKKCLTYFPKEIKIGEDLLSNIIIGLNVNNIKGISDIVYIYNIHEENATRTTSPSMKYEDTLENHLEQLLSKNKQYGEVLFRRMMNIIEQYITNEDITQSQIAQKAIIQSKYFRINNKERFLLFLCKIKNVLVRQLLWKAATKMRKIQLAI